MLKIDKEFSELIPALTEEEFKGLEESIIKEGCRDALITWNGVLVDGHNRYNICQKHNIVYSTIEKDFATRDDAIVWIINNQFGRRNISLAARTGLALKLEDTISRMAKENSIKSGGDRGNQYTKGKVADLKNSTKPAKVHTRKELAKAAGVSEFTVYQYKTVEKNGTPEVIEKMKKDEISVNKAFEITTGKKKGGGENIEKEKPTETTLKICSFCGIKKPIAEFRKHNECRDCHAVLRRNENPCTRQTLRDLECDSQGILDAMSNKEPANGDSKKEYINSVTLELIEILNSLNTSINKYVYVNMDNDAELIKSLEKSINNLNKILKNSKGE